MKSLLSAPHKPPRRFQLVVQPSGLRIYTYRRFVGDIALGCTFPLSGANRRWCAERVRHCRRVVIDDQAQLRKFLERAA